MTDLHLHFHFPPVGSSALSLFTQLKALITMNQTELQTALEGIGGSLTDVGTQLDKATNEIIVAISNAGTTSPAVDAAVANLRAVATALKAASQGLDDLNPDAPAAP